MACWAIPQGLLFPSVRQQCRSGLRRLTLLPVKPQKRRRTMVSFPPIFARVNKAGTPVVVVIVGVLMIIFQFSSMSPNAAKEFGLVSSVSVIHRCLIFYTCAALLLLLATVNGKARPLYLLDTFVAFAGIASGRHRFRRQRSDVVVRHVDGEITAPGALNYNRIHKTRIRWMRRLNRIDHV